MPLSNYTKAHTVRNGPHMSEVVCRRCKGLGEDPDVEGADCLACWGDGTLLLTGEDLVLE